VLLCQYSIAPKKSIIKQTVGLIKRNVSIQIKQMSVLSGYENGSQGGALASGAFQRTKTGRNDEGPEK
jgi:hypothetical protein